MRTTIFTIGHSTHTLEEFVELLRSYGIRQIVDIRSIPCSRHNPQFNREMVGKFLRSHRIGYRHMKDLGGLRRTRTDSPNTGWKNLSFRGYADYMGTREFRNAVDELIILANRKCTALMCAEALPWRCHRSLVGDALLTRGVEVKDIMGQKTVRNHALTSWAKVTGCMVTYPPGKEDE